MMVAISSPRKRAWRATSSSLRFDRFPRLRNSPKCMTSPPPLRISFLSKTMIFSRCRLILKNCNALSSWNWPSRKSTLTEASSMIYSAWGDVFVA